MEKGISCPGPLTPGQQKNGRVKRKLRQTDKQKTDRQTKKKVNRQVEE